MALYRLSIKSGASGSSRAHFDYISRNGKYKKAENKNLKEDFIFSDSFNVPSWAKNPRDFWKEEEKKGDGYKKIEVALPMELTHEKQKKLLEEFLENEFGKDYVYSYAIHENIGTLSNKKNPHAHIMFSERKIEQNREVDRENWFKRGGKKKDGTISGGYRKDRKFLKQTGSNWVHEIRQSWEDVQNDYLKEYGKHLKVSCKSLAEQGIDRTPQIHIGAKSVRAVTKRLAHWKMVQCETKILIPHLKNIDYEIVRLEKEQAKIMAELKELELPKNRIKGMFENVKEFVKTHNNSVVKEEKPKIVELPSVTKVEKVESIITPKPTEKRRTDEITAIKKEEKIVSAPKFTEKPKIIEKPSVAKVEKVESIITPKPTEKRRTDEITAIKSEEKSISVPKVTEKPISAPKLEEKAVLSPLEKIEKAFKDNNLNEDKSDFLRKQFKKGTLKLDEVLDFSNKNTPLKEIRNHVKSMEQNKGISR